MAQPPPRPAFRPPVALAVFLVVAFSIGLAATFLAAPAVAPGPTPAAQGRGAVSIAVVGWFSVALLVVLVVGLIVRRLFARSAGSAGRSVVSFLVAFLLALLFLVAVRFINPTAVGFETLPDPSGSSTPGSGPGNVTIPGNTTFLPSPLTPHLPGWLLYVGIGAALLIAVVVVPLLAARRAQAAVPVPVPAAVRQTFEEALAALMGPESAGARGVVIRLYAQLLERIGPQLDSVETATAREIEQACVTRFGIHADHARALTRLFEEARYSTHPFTDREVEQTRSALSLALADMERSGHQA